MIQMNAPNPSEVDSTESAFEFLRREVIDAHLAGDGMRVLHICAIALEQLAERYRRTGVPFPLHRFRWVFFLGLHWMVDEWLTYAMKSLFAESKPDAESEWDKKLIDFLVTTFHIPVNFGAVDELLQAPDDWLRARSDRIDDVVALSLAVEISWYGNPGGTEWRTLAEAWTSKLEESNLRSALGRLIKRLTVQSEFRGVARLPDQELLSEISSKDQLDLVLAWKLFYQANFATLNTELRRLAIKTSVESPNYTALYWLLHFSRIHRDSEEDQFTSMSRRQYIASRSPAQACRNIRDERFESNFSKLYGKGFSDGGASERFTCFRMALQNQLHALRSWDIGTWILGERQRARILLELSTHGNAYTAVDGILALRNSIGVPNKPGSNVFFDRAVELLDVLPEPARHANVSELMQSPRIAWGDAHRIFELLSDAIPSDLLAELAVWYVRLDLDEFHGRWTHTWLGGWGFLLEKCDDAVRLIEILKPALLKKAGDFRCWDHLHGTLVEAIIKGESSLAFELVKVLVSANCPQPHFDEFRFSILYNVARFRPALTSVPRAWLLGYTELRADPYKQFTLRNLDATANQSIDDQEFRTWVRDRLIAACNRSLSQKEGSVEIGTLKFHGMVFNLTWPDQERALEEVLIQVVDSDYVPYVNKFEPIACLAMLVLRLPVDDGSKIVQAAIRWLENGITGRDLGHHGPLSIGQTRGFGPGAIDDAFATLLEAIASRYFKVAGQSLCRWVITRGARQPMEVAAHTIATALHCSVGVRNSDPALASALVAIADGIATSVQSKHPAKVVRGFADVVFEDPTSQKLEWLKTQAGRLCLELWQHRLIEVSQVPSPDAREAAAVAIRQWSASEIELPGKLREVMESLRNDCRLRVRKAIAKVE
jgi:hypothetical protein